MTERVIMVSTLDGIVIALQSNENSNGERVIRWCRSIKEIRLGSEAWQNTDHFGSD